MTVTRQSLTPLLGLLLFIAVAFIHGNSRITTSNSDSRWTLFVAHSLIHERNLDLREFEPELARANDYCIYRHEGVPYNLFPVLPSLMAVPFLVAYEAAPQIVSTMLPGMGSAKQYAKSRGTYPTALQVRAPLERAIASILVAGAALALFTLASLIVGPWQALIVGITFAFATSAWSTASRSLWQHGPSILLSSLILLIMARGTTSTSTHGLMGALLAAAYIARPTNAIFVMLMLTYQYVRNRPTFSLIMTPFCVVLGVFILWSYLTYGSLLPPYYQPGRLEVTALAPEAFLGNLISPGRGLFIFSPVLLFSVWGMVILVRGGADRVFESMLSISIVLHLVSISLYPHWWGGFSYGPRLSSDILPALCFYLIPALAQLTAQVREKKYLPSLLFALLLALSIWIHYRGANDPAVIRWDKVPVSVDDDPSRVWDWRDPPFLR